MKAEEIKQLSEVIQRWQDFSDHTARRLRDAEKTREFWEESSSKLIVCRHFLMQYFQIVK